MHVSALAKKTEREEGETIMTTVEEIRARYPHPVISIARRPGAYCVGGALCRFVGVEAPQFPWYREIEKALRVLNPFLTNDVAFDFAQRIVNRNDEGKFDDAWEAVREALAWRP